MPSCMWPLEDRWNFLGPSRRGSCRCRRTSRSTWWLRGQPSGHDPWRCCWPPTTSGTWAGVACSPYSPSCRQWRGKVHRGRHRYRCGKNGKQGCRRGQRSQSFADGMTWARRIYPAWGSCRAPRPGRVNTGPIAAFHCASEGWRRNTMHGVIGSIEFSALLSEGGRGVAWVADGIGCIWK